MASKRTDENEKLERDTLRFLCSVLIQPATRAELLALLDSSQFSISLHRIVYEEIRVLGAVPSRTLRELLPGRVAKRGFPDFDIKEFLGPFTASETEVEDLYMSVLEMIECRHRDQGPVLEN